MATRLAIPRLIDFIEYIMSIYQLKVIKMLLFVNFYRLIFLPILLQKNDILILDKIIEKNNTSDKKN